MGETESTTETAEGSAPSTRAGGRKAEQSEATRAALIAAARRLFGERGYAAVGTEEIVRAAGVTRGALYHHFGGKRELLEAVYEQVEGEITQRIAEGALAGSDPLEAMRAGAADVPRAPAWSPRCSGSSCSMPRRCWAGTAGGRSPAATGSA